MTQSAALLVERLGRDNAAQLVARVGGSRLSIPTRLAGRAHRRLTDLLGENLAILVVLHFGDSRLSVPLSLDGPGGARAPVDVAKVRALLKRGWSSSRIARKLGCSERTITAKRATLRARSASRNHKRDDDEG